MYFCLTSMQKKERPLKIMEKNWKKGFIKDLVSSLESGISVNGESKPATKMEKGVLKVSSISYGKFSPSENKKIIDSDLNRAKTNPGKDRILISRSNGSKDLVGASVYIDKNYENLYLPDKLWQVQPNNNKQFLMRWLYFYINTNRIKELIKSSSTGSSSMRNLKKEDFLNFPILIPPYETQQKIVDAISTWDKAITQTQQLIEAKQKLKRGLMQQLLTGKARFPEFGKPSKNGELPEGWKQIKLKECFKERKESAPDLPLLSITSSRGVIYRDDVERKDTSNEDKSKYKKIVPGDIGYNTMRMWQGVSAVSELEGIVSPAYTVCQPRKNTHSTYFGYLFKYAPIVKMFHRHSQGLVSDTLNLKFPLFSKIPVVIPSFDEQVKIARCLSEIDKEIEQLEQKIVSLEHQKQGLMQKLLTGQIRVPVKEN